MTKPEIKKAALRIVDEVCAGEDPLTTQIERIIEQELRALLEPRKEAPRG